MSRQRVLVPWRVNLLLDRTRRDQMMELLQERGQSLSEWAREQMDQAIQLYSRLSVPRKDAPL